MQVLSVGVMGAGAVGCWLGGKLALQGHEVILVGRARAERELADGLTLTELDGRRVEVPPDRYAVTSDPSRLAGCDVVLCCVKSGQTSEVAKTLADVIAKDTIVISMQNGVGNAGRLRAALPKAIVLGGIVGFNVVADGARFRRAVSGTLVIERHDDPRLVRLTHALESAGFELELPQDIEPLQWTKLIMNLNNAIGALSDAPTRDLLFVKGYRRILRAVMREGLAVLAKAGIEPVRIGPLPPRLYPKVLALPNWLLRVVARAQLKIDPEARSSMWQDLSRSRLTEVDYLNGEIVALAERVGAEAPLNRRIVALIHEVERAGNGSPKLRPDQLWDALRS